MRSRVFPRVIVPIGVHRKKARQTNVLLLSSGKVQKAAISRILPTEHLSFSFFDELHDYPRLLAVIRDKLDGLYCGTRYVYK